MDLSPYKKAIVEEADYDQLDTMRGEEKTGRISMLLKTPERCSKKQSEEACSWSDPQAQLTTDALEEDEEQTCIRKPNPSMVGQLNHKTAPASSKVTLSDKRPHKQLVLPDTHEEVSDLIANESPLQLGRVGMGMSKNGSF